MIALQSISGGDLFAIDSIYQRFLTDEAPEIRLRIHYDPIPELQGWQVAFETGGIWALYRNQDRWGISLSTAALGNYQLAILNDDYSDGDIYIKLRTAEDEPLPFPLNHPLDELIMINLLGQRRGILLHACGLRYQGQGLLFVGNSGAGKSTTARLWREREGVQLLSDDRIILRQSSDHEYHIYGTPWLGDAEAAAPLSAPLSQIFVLRHAQRNQAAPIKPVDATARLLVRSFPPFWSVEGMDFTLDLLSRVSQSIPCYDLGFVPNPEIFDYILDRIA